MTSAPTVLVLDGNTTQALACVRSLGRAGYAVYIASDRRAPLASWSRYCRGKFRLRGETVAEFAAMREWARSRGVRVVLPLTERSCLLCNADAAAWRGRDMILGCGPDTMLLEAFDKARTLQRAMARGVPVPPTRLPTSLAGFHTAARELGFPCVIKARFSHARQGDEFLPDPGVAYVNDVAALTPAVLARRQGDAWPLIQRFVTGRGKGVFALCDHGRPVTWFAHERLRDVRPSGSGSSLRRSIPLDARLRESAGRLLADLEWHGPAMLEFVDDGVSPPRLMEMNGRFWGSLQLAIEAGADFPALWVRVLTGEHLPAPVPYDSGVVLRWLWGDVKRLLHVLRGPPPGYPGSYPAIWKGVRELFGRQPPGTRLETWDRTDPWPAVAEWVQGIGELVGHARGPRPRRPRAARPVAAAR